MVGYKANGLNGGKLTYFGNQMTFACILAAVSPIFGPMHAMVSRYGRFWYFIPQCCVAVNDAFAYFVGRAFGRTKLIGVSPSKTVEGFVGGMVCNIIQIFYFSGVLLERPNSEYWTCGS